MASLGDFAKRIKLKAEGIERNVDTLVKKTAIAVDQTVVLATPVDTGRARSNWLVRAGYPDTRKVEPYAPGSKLGKGEGANAQAALQQGQAAISARKPRQDIYISNNLPYIQSLNDGHSAQAPAGFIEKAIRAGVSVVKRTKVVK